MCEELAWLAESCDGAWETTPPPPSLTTTNNITTLCSQHPLPAQCHADFSVGLAVSITSSAADQPSLPTHQLPQHQFREINNNVEDDEVNASVSSSRVSHDIVHTPPPLSSCVSSATTLQTTAPAAVEAEMSVNEIARGPVVLLRPAAAGRRRLRLTVKRCGAGSQRLAAGGGEDDAAADESGACDIESQLSLDTRLAVRNALLQSADAAERDGPTVEGDMEAGSLACHVCCRRFTRRHDLKNHLGVHLGIMQCVCHVCGRRFSHKSNFYRHLRTHTGERPYLCCVCGCRFTQANSLRLHMRVHRPVVSTSTQTTTPATVDRPHSTLCDTVFDRNSELAQHTRLAHRLDKRVSRFHCDQCGAMFERKAQLTRHKCLRHTATSSESTAQMALSLCAERDNAAVDTHTTDELVDKGSVQMPLQSPPSAGYKISRVDSRSASTAAAVTQCGSANVCDVCGRRFARRQNLLHHRAMHNAELRRYSCAQCGLRFAWKQTLDRHVLSHSRSPDALSVECPVCHRRFRKHSLSGHIRRMHVGGKHHGCVTCGKLFFQKSELAAHAKSHSHEKRHACSLCSKCFKHSFHLARHVKSAHNVDDKTNGGENN